MCPQGTPKWTRPQKRGKDHQKRGRRGHSWRKLFNADGIKIGRQCTNCSKKHIVPEMRE